MGNTLAQDTCCVQNSVVYRHFSIFSWHTSDECDFSGMDMKTAAYASSLYQQLYNQPCTCIGHLEMYRRKAISNLDKVPCIEYIKLKHKDKKGYNGMSD